MAVGSMSNPVKPDKRLTLADSFWFAVGTLMQQGMFNSSIISLVTLVITAVTVNREETRRAAVSVSLFLLFLSSIMSIYRFRSNTNRYFY